LVNPDAAVPSVFPNLHGYLSKAAPKERSETTSSTFRHQQAADALEDQSAEFLAADEMSNLTELQQKLNLQCLPKGWDAIFRDDCAIFTLLTVEDFCPQLAASLVIQSSMNISVWRGGVPVPNKAIAHIVGLNFDATCSQILNILSFLKNSTDSRTGNKVDYCVSLLESILDDDEEGDGPLTSKLQFIAEQLRLLQKVPQQRRYSLKFFATCVLWENSSPNLYRQMTQEDLITLPSSK
jgi:hypothetical protein